MNIKRSIFPLLLLLLPPTSLAIEKQHVRDRAHTVYDLYLTPQEAFNMKKHLANEVLLVDIRARSELKYVGSTPMIDANIPYRFVNPDYSWSDNSATYRTVKNEHFIQDLKQLLQQRNHDITAPVILMCTSGTKAPKAAELMQEAGFETVYTIYQGFEGIKAKQGVNSGKRLIYGWKNSGLPWSYKLNKEAMYFNFDASRQPQAVD